jgi:hypothetical protein
MNGDMTACVDPAFSGIEIRIVNSRCDCLKNWLKVYIDKRFSQTSYPIRYRDTTSGSSRIYLEIRQIDSIPGMRQLHENRYKEIKTLHTAITRSKRFVHITSLDQYNVIENYSCLHIHLKRAYEAIQRRESELILCIVLFICLLIGVFG